MRFVRRDLLALLLPVGLCLATQTVSAQGVETILAEQGAKALTGEVLSKQISEIISELRAAGASLIAQAADSGNGLTARIGNELSVTADNAAAAFGAQLNNTVAQASADAQPTLAQLNYLGAHYKDLLKNAYDMKDAMVLDVRAITWPLTGEYFYIQRIDGTTQLPKKEGSYTVTVKGTGLGIPSSRLKSDVRLMVNNKSYSSVDSLDSSTANFQIPVADLPSNPRKLVLYKATIHVTQSVKAWLLPWWTDHTAPDVNIGLSIYPPLYATIAVNVTEPQLEWSKIRTESQALQTGDHNCAKCPNPPKAPYTLTIQVPNQKKGTPQLGDQELRSVQLQCQHAYHTISFFGGKPLTIDGSACPWTSQTPPSLSENKSRAEGKLLAWGSPTSWQMTAEVWEYSAVGETKQLLQAQDADFDTIVEFDVPSREGVVSIGLGKTYSNEPVEFVLGQNTDMLQLQQKVLSPVGTAKYLYKVLAPR